jgi:hypothetical protein
VVGSSQLRYNKKKKVMRKHMIRTGSEIVEIINKTYEDISIKNHVELEDGKWSMDLYDGKEKIKKIRYIPSYFKGIEKIEQISENPCYYWQGERSEEAVEIEIATKLDQTNDVILLYYYRDQVDGSRIQLYVNNDLVFPETWDTTTKNSPQIYSWFWSCVHWLENVSPERLFFLYEPFTYSIDDAILEDLKQKRNG